MSVAVLLRSTLFCSTESGLSVMHPDLPLVWTVLASIALATLSIHLLFVLREVVARFTGFRLWMLTRPMLVRL